MTVVSTPPRTNEIVLCSAASVLLRLYVSPGLPGGYLETPPDRARKLLFTKVFLYSGKHAKYESETVGIRFERYR